MVLSQSLSIKPKNKINQGAVIMSSLVLHSHLSALLCVVCCCCCCSFGLGFAPQHPIIQTAATRHYLSSQDDVADSEKATASSFVNTDTSASTLFPVISKIAGTEFTGTCRYINSKLQHVTNLKLFGGVKYEIIGSTHNQQQQEQQQEQLQLKLSSFLTFPNGQTRQVVMQGERRSSSRSTNDDDNIMTLHPADNDGPIIMKISEIIPDTILINEVEKNSGRIIMTSSISIVQTSRGGLELVGVSHEVGDDNNDGSSSAETIEGHQIWRMRGPVVKEKVVLSGQFD